jgi:hypothetical protein
MSALVPSPEITFSHLSDKRGRALLLRIRCWILASCLASCTLQVDQGPVAYLEERLNPPQESQWNATRVWKRVSMDPPTYVPAGFSGSLAYSSEAEWITDSRDGKRFFIPRGGVETYNEAILRAEASKNCHPRPPHFSFQPVEVSMPHPSNSFGGMPSFGGAPSLGPGSFSCAGMSMGSVSCGAAP